MGPRRLLFNIVLPPCPAKERVEERDHAVTNPWLGARFPGAESQTVGYYI
jgi:hypothetical protein